MRNGVWENHVLSRSDGFRIGDPNQWRLNRELGREP